MTGVSVAQKGLIGLAFAGSLLFAGSALGGVSYPTVTVEFFAGNDGQPPAVYNMAEHSEQMTQTGSEYNFTGGTKGLNDTWEFNWDITVNSSFDAATNTSGGGGGPFIHLANLAVSNNTSENQIFWVLVTLELDAPINTPTFSRGDVATTIQSFTGVGATLQNITSGEYAGDPIYEAFIDGNSTASLMDAPDGTLNSTGFDTASADDSFGYDVPLATGPATDTLSIWLKVEVSALSVATVIGLYEVAPIPAPAGLALLALGGIAVRRRRRN